MRRRSLLPLASGLFLVGMTLALAAPPVTAVCPEPDAATCVSEGYVESKCGKQHAAICKPHVEDAMEAHYEASSAPKLTMLPHGKREMPKDLTQGRYFAYSPKAKFASSHAQLAKVYRKLDDVLATHAGMSMAATAPVDRVSTISAAIAKTYHREPKWEANGDKVESCAEYAYESSYDVTRFIDAASACKGDRECVFDVAYLNATPGVARRTLVDTGGKALPKLTLPTGKFPKNDLFLLGSRFVRSNGTQPLAATPAILALEGALNTGDEYYEIGTCTGNGCNATRKFASVWDWHDHLHSATSTMSDAEAEEYDRRRAEFRALLENWAATVDKEHASLMQVEGGVVVLPYDEQTRDPFERFELGLDYVERGSDQFSAVKAKFGSGIFEKSLDEALKSNVKNQVQGARSGAAMMGVMAAPAPTTPSSNPTPKNNAGQLDPCLRADGWGLEMNAMGPASCKIGKFLRDEWARKEAGQRSCLDLDNPRCDWTREMFEAGIVAGIPALDRQLADERYCKAWQDGATFPSNSVAAVETKLAANEAAFAEIWPLIKDFDRGSSSTGRTFGKDWEGGDYFGDKDWFAAGYDYALGWEVGSTGKNGDGIVCELGGQAHAETGFDAWIVGGKVQIVDGSVWAKSNVGSNDQVSFNAHLEMFDETLFSTEGWKVATTFASDPSSGFGVSLPKPKPRFDIYVGVPISGQLWGELMFGSVLTMSGKAGSCNASKPEFAIRTSYGPFFAAYGVGQIGVGIAGLVSAGIRASLNLLMIQLPVEVEMSAKTKQNKQVLSFNSELSLLVSTLSGRVSLYIEFLLYDEEWELFRWSGIGPAKVPLMPKLAIDVPLSGMKN